MSVVMSMVVSATGDRLGLLLVMMIVTAAAVMIMLVLLFMGAGGMVISPVIMIMIVTATFMMMVPVILVMPVVMIATFILFGANGGKIEQPKYPEADPGHQNHGTENAVCRQVVDETATGVKVEKHRSPEHEQKYAQKMNTDSGCFHGDSLFRKQLNEHRPGFAENPYQHEKR